jgi:hypothetical protein
MNEEVAMRQSNGGNRVARAPRKAPAIPDEAEAAHTTTMPKGEMVGAGSSAMPRGDMTSARPTGAGPMPKGEMVRDESSDMPRGPMTPYAEASRS